MKSKFLLGGVLTGVGATGLVYGLVSEIDSFVSKGPLVGIILLSVIVFFAGVTLLRGAYGEHL